MELKKLSSFDNPRANWLSKGEKWQLVCQVIQLHLWPQGSSKIDLRQRHRKNKIRRNDELGIEGNGEGMERGKMRENNIT